MVAVQGYAKKYFYRTWYHICINYNKTSTSPALFTRYLWFHVLFPTTSVTIASAAVWVSICITSSTTLLSSPSSTKIDKKLLTLKKDHKHQQTSTSSVNKKGEKHHYNPNNSPFSSPPTPIIISTSSSPLPPFP